MRMQECVAMFNLRMQTRKVMRDGVVLAVVLELLGRHGGAKEILQILQHVLLGRRKGARLGVRVELIGHCHGSEDALLAW